MDVGLVRQKLMHCSCIVTVPQPLDMPTRDPDDEPLDPVQVEILPGLIVEVDPYRTEAARDFFLRQLNSWSDAPDAGFVPPLTEGLSYTHIGCVLGSQSGAFQLLAVGKVLGFWDIITPQKLGFEGEEAARMAGLGMVLASGYHPEATP